MFMNRLAYLHLLYMVGTAIWSHSLSLAVKATVMLLDVSVRARL